MCVVCARDLVSVCSYRGLLWRQRRLLLPFACSMKNIPKSCLFIVNRRPLPDKREFQPSSQWPVQRGACPLCAEQTQGGIVSQISADRGARAPFASNCVKWAESNPHRSRAPGRRSDFRQWRQITCQIGPPWHLVPAAAPGRPLLSNEHVSNRSSNSQTQCLIYRHLDRPTFLRPPSASDA